jgi:mycofactocin precursor
MGMKSTRGFSPRQETPWPQQPEGHKMTCEEEPKPACEGETSGDSPEAQDILEEIEIEELAVDGICGVY